MPFPDGDRFVDTMKEPGHPLSLMFAEAFDKGARMTTEPKTERQRSASALQNKAHGRIVKARFALDKACDAKEYAAKRADERIAELRAELRAAQEAYKAFDSSYVVPEEAKPA